MKKKLISTLKKKKSDLQLKSSKSFIKHIIFAIDITNELKNFIINTMKVSKH